MLILGLDINKANSEIISENLNKNESLKDFIRRKENFWPVSGLISFF